MLIKPVSFKHVKHPYLPAPLELHQPEAPVVDAQVCCSCVGSADGTPLWRHLVAHPGSAKLEAMYYLQCTSMTLVNLQEPDRSRVACFEGLIFPVEKHLVFVEATQFPF